MAEPRHESGQEHEDAGIDTQRILFIAAVMLTGLALVISVTWLIWYSLIEQRGNALPGGGKQAMGQVVAGAPRLQAHPDRDIRDHRARKSSELESYGWVDRKAGIAHIPVERAMQLLVHPQASRSPASPDAHGDAR